MNCSQYRLSLFVVDLPTNLVYKNYEIFDIDAEIIKIENLENYFLINHVESQKNSYIYNI